MEKKMKEITTYEAVWVSNDGKEFKTEEDCKKWEESYKCTMETSFASIKKATADATALGFPCFDATTYVIKPESLDDIVIINAYVDAIAYEVSNHLSAEHIGKVVALVITWDNDYASFNIMADHIEGIANYLDKRLAEME